MKLSVIIPVYNEEKTVAEIIRRVRQAPAEELEKEIIAVDDASTDGSAEILKQTQGIIYLAHEKNSGKGSAIRTGLEKATGDILLIQDADLEYSPDDYPRLLEPILMDKADVVYGSRFLGGPHRALFFWHYAGNKFLTLLCNLVSDLNLTDMETGYKVFRRQVPQEMRLTSRRFGFEPEFTIKAARRGFRFYEVPISYDGRGYAEGKKITWRDGIAAICVILKTGLCNRKKR